MTAFTEGPDGFAWGAISVTRRFSHEGRVSLSLATDTGRDIHVYVSATGKSVRFFEGNQEYVLTPKGAK